MTELLDCIIGWTMFILSTVLVLYIFAHFIVAKHNNKIKTKIDMLMMPIILVAVLMAFIAMLFGAKESALVYGWFSYFTAAVTFLLTLIIRKTIAEKIKESTTIIKRKIWASD